MCCARAYAVAVCAEDAILAQIIGLSAVHKADLVLAQVGDRRHEVAAADHLGFVDALVQSRVVGDGRSRLGTHLGGRRRLLCNSLPAARGHVGRGRELLALYKICKRRWRLLFERDQHKAKHQKVVDDLPRKGHPHVLEMPRKHGLQVDVAALPTHHDARAEQLAEQDGTRCLDGRRRVVQVRNRNHRIRGDADFARTTGVNRV